MTVAIMIERLSKIKDKEKPLKVFHQNRSADWLKLDIDSIADNDEEVLIGNDLPAEVFERDYKY